MVAAAPRRLRILCLFLVLAPAVGPVATALAEGVDPTSPCVSSPTRLCVGDGRFEVAVEWQTPAPGSGNGRLAELAAPESGGGRSAVSSDSALFWFFGEDNWEMLVKVLDGCSSNQRFWVFGAATTDVGFNLEVTDTWTGELFTSTNPVGLAAPALADTQAMSACGVSPPVVPVASCTPAEDTACLHSGRFQVRVGWSDSQGGGGPAQVVELGAGGSQAALPLTSADSGVFWFFQSDNWELLVKVLDGCDINDRFWVFSSATTNVGYTLSVTDRRTGQTRRYLNPVGRLADAVTDTDAFDTCGSDPPSSVELRLVSARDHIEGHFLTGGTVWADRDLIYLASFPGDLFVLKRDREADFPLLDTLHLSDRALRAVRGDEKGNLYVTGDEGVIFVLEKTGEEDRPLELVRSVSLAQMGVFPSFDRLMVLAIREPWLYAVSHSVGMAVNAEHAFFGVRFLNGPGIEFGLKVLKDELSAATLFDFDDHDGTTAVFDRHSGELVTVFDDAKGSEIYADDSIVARMIPGCCGDGVYLADAVSLAQPFAFPVSGTPSANAAVRKGPWLLVGDEGGRIRAVDLRPSIPRVVASIPLKPLTGHTEPEAIEIRAIWADRHDNLVFGASSWGNDDVRGPDLPSFFVVEMVETP